MDKRKTITDEQRANVINLYKNGDFTLRIANKLGIGRTSVCRILKANGVRIKTPKEAGQDQRKEFLDKDGEIIDLYLNKNYTCRKIAKKYNTSEGYIQSVIHRNDIKLRTPDIWTREYALNENYFKTIDTHNKAMILGFIYADGNVIQNSARIKIAEEDFEFLEMIRNEINSQNPITKVYDKKLNKNYILLALNSKIIANDLRNLGCVDNKSFKIRFPKWLDKEFWPSFIAGYYFGDGSSVWVKDRGIKKKKCTFQICSNTEFVLELKEIIESSINNIHCSIYITKNPKTASLSIGGHFKILKIMKWMYQNTFITMKRKHNMLNELINLRSPVYLDFFNKINFHLNS